MAIILQSSSASCLLFYDQNKPWFCRMVYSSNERSVDFCPIEDIDANSTVTVSISTESKTPVEVFIRVLIKGRNSDWKKSQDQKCDSMIV